MAVGIGTVAIANRTGTCTGTPLNLGGGMLPYTPTPSNGKCEHEIFTFTVPTNHLAVLSVYSVIWYVFRLAQPRAVAAVEATEAVASIILAKVILCFANGGLKRKFDLSEGNFGSDLPLLVKLHKIWSVDSHGNH